MAYDPGQPRDPGGKDGGQWVKGGGGAADPRTKPTVAKNAGGFASAFSGIFSAQPAKTIEKRSHHAPKDGTIPNPIGRPSKDPSVRKGKALAGAILNGTAAAGAAIKAGGKVVADAAGNLSTGDAHADAVAKRFLLNAGLGVAGAALGSAARSAFGPGINIGGTGGTGGRGPSLGSLLDTRPIPNSRTTVVDRKFQIGFVTKIKRPNY